MINLNRKIFLSFLFFVFLVFFIGLLGNFFTFSSVNDWYVTLKKPSWTPPDYVFGPVWTLLYLMIAVSGSRIYVKCLNTRERKRAYVLYGLQLLCNFLWTFFFFYLKSPLLGLIDISALLGFLFLNIKAFYKLDKISGLLLIPYFIWTFYAGILNVAIWGLNSSWKLF